MTKAEIDTIRQHCDDLSAMTIGTYPAVQLLIMDAYKMIAETQKLRTVAQAADDVRREECFDGIPRTWDAMCDALDAWRQND